MRRERLPGIPIILLAFIFVARERPEASLHYNHLQGCRGSQTLRNGNHFRTYTNHPNAPATLCPLFTALVAMHNCRVAVIHTFFSFVQSSVPSIRLECISLSGPKDAEKNLNGNKTDKGKLIWQRVLNNTLAYDLGAHASVLLRVQGEYACFKPVLVALIEEEDKSVKLTRESYKQMADRINKTASASVQSTP